jgi:superfamily II DNA helicase RecQ
VHHYEHHLLDSFGSGKEDGENLWNSLMRQALLDNYLSKDIDQYGLLQLNQKGQRLFREPAQHPLYPERAIGAMMMMTQTALKVVVAH